MTTSRITITLTPGGTAGADLAVIVDHDGEAHLDRADRWPAWKATRARLACMIHARHDPGMSQSDVVKVTIRHLEGRGILARDESAVLRFTGSTTRGDRATAGT